MIRASLRRRLLASTRKKLMKLTQWICELLEKKQKRLDNKANEELPMAIPAPPGTMFAVGRNLLSIRTNCMATQNL